jgi:hypothetical protein
MAWFLVNNLLHFDNKTLALLEMSDPQISETIVHKVYQDSIKDFLVISNSSPQTKT